MNRPQPRTLFEEIQPIDIPFDSLNLTTIREGFSTLFDRALLGVQKEGLDLDDVEFNRFLLCRTAQENELKVPANSLSDLDFLKNSVIKHIQSREINSQVDDLHVIGLTVEIVSDQPL